MWYRAVMVVAAMLCGGNAKASTLLDYTFASIDALAAVAAGGDRLANAKGGDFIVGLQNADFLDSQIKEAKADLWTYRDSSNKTFTDSYSQMINALNALDKDYVKQSSLYESLLNNPSSGSKNKGTHIYDLDELNPVIKQDWLNLTYAAQTVPALWCCQPQTDLLGPPRAQNVV